MTNINDITENTPLAFEILSTNNGRQVVQVITNHPKTGSPSLDSYIKTQKPFLPIGADILRNGSVMTDEGSVRLGNIGNGKTRFAYTWMGN